MPNRLVTYAVQQGIAHIGLNDADRLNVLSRALVTDLNDALDTAENDHQVSTIIVFGHGRAFCVGGDLKEFIGVQSPPEQDFVTAWERIANCTLPVVAAVHGYTIGGGCEVMLMTDYILAATQTKFGQPELKIGFVPGCGATQRLSNRIGFAKAFDLMASGKKISSSEALSIGLIDQVTEDESLLKVAQDLALNWQKQGREELINLKKAMKLGYQVERKLFFKMVSSDKAQTNIHQFLDKE